MKMTKKQKTENLFGYIFVGPQLLGFLLFVAFPLVFSIYLCFSYWDFNTMPTFIGLQNFEAIFRDEIFWKSIGNTFIYILITEIIRLL